VGTGVEGGAELEVAAAYLLALDATRRNADDNVQNHGGIGFTAEHPAGVFVKRAQVYSHLAGGVSDLVNTLLRAPRTNLDGVTVAARGQQVPVAAL
jgi:alkylation response protein AidB-like acyl-CoA dehydrogenase